MTEPTAPRVQKRGRRIAMTPDELDVFLGAERTCRVATTGPDGPHATPLWFVWHDGAVWLYSITRSRRWADLQRDPRVGLVVDAGREYLDLHGVELTGTATVVGDVPRAGAPVGELDAVEALFARKYFAIDELYHDGKHAWLKVVPMSVVSWDFRKIATGAGS